MNKKLILAVLLFIFSLSKAQVSIGASENGKLEKFDKEVFQKFKNTTTIFILSNIYDKESYETLLKEVWTITPYQIVSPTDFDYRNFLTDKFSFAHLRSYCEAPGTSFYLKSLIDFYYLDLEKINKKLQKVINKQEKFVELILDNKINVGAIKLSVSTEVIDKANKNFGSGGGISILSKSPEYSAYSLKTGDEKLSNYRKEMIDLIYNKNSLPSFTLGFFKNNLKQVNELIKKEQFLWLYDDFKTAEIKNLAKQILFLSESLKTRYNPNKFRDEDWKAGALEEIISKYKYKTQFVSQNDLDTKIKSGEEIYYLRCVRVNSEKFFEVVNAKSGDVIYHLYKSGLSEYNIKEKDFEELNKAILSK